MRRLPQQIFVTGTGTGVGKTVVSAILTEALVCDYWKPIQAGSLENTDTDVVKSLVVNKSSQFHPEACRLTTAASPHYAAEKDGAQIALSNCKPPATERRLIIEGPGGLMVPLNRKELVVDLIEYLKTPVILVAGNYLGAINHTLLSVEILKQRKIELLGLIFNGGNLFDNEEIISHFAQVPILYSMGEFKEINLNFMLGHAAKLRTSLAQHFEF